MDSAFGPRLARSCFEGGELQLQDPAYKDGSTYAPFERCVTDS